VLFRSSGDNTRLSLCRSTDKAIKREELVQLTIGAKYMGYCGNMCRPFVIGKVPKSVRNLMEAALEAVAYSLDVIRPGVVASDVFKGYFKLLSKYHYEDFTLYGPAHGTGSSEVEGLWLAENANFVITKGMLFNIDVWLSDGNNGLRYEDGILVTETGIKELTNYRREIIEL
jgi:Xaa-Pro aminopeptidase